MQSRLKQLSVNIMQIWLKRDESCCSSSSCCDTEINVEASLSQDEYTNTQLSSIPADAVENSFGCGNPLMYADICEGDVVLDLGSGAGIDVLLAAQFVGEKREGDWH